MVKKFLRIIRTDTYKKATSYFKIVKFNKNGLFQNEKSLPHKKTNDNLINKSIMYFYGF